MDDWTCAMEDAWRDLGICSQKYERMCMCARVHV